jgi:D-alanyl-D-alanine carboxypeptidase
MSLQPRPEEPQTRGEHAALIFAAVAIFVLGSLFLIGRFASGEEEAPLVAVVATPVAASAVKVEEAHADPIVGPATVIEAIPSQAVLAEAHTATPESAEETPATTTEPAPPVEEAQPAAAQLEAEVTIFAQSVEPAAPPPAPRPSSPPPMVGASSYAIVERSCGAVLWGKAERERLPPASLTKIITALVVEEQARLNDMVDINVSGTQMARRGSSVMGVEPNMRLSVIDLLYGLFLPSGNDAALALAEHVSGSVNRFVELMNAKASQIGMTDTYFRNPHGLDSAGLYSSALDMAMAGRAFLDEPLLAQISVTPEYRPAWDGPTLKNGNKLLQMYPGSFGVKIGYTTNARQTIVAAAERNGRQIIVSLFGSQNRYEDTISLFNWAFSRAPSAC